LSLDALGIVKPRQSRINPVPLRQRTLQMNATQPVRLRSVKLTGGYNTALL
jgi:hypothetical protein